MAVLPSGLTEVVADDEDLARYLTSSSHFISSQVKAAAFLPRDGQTSVFRHGKEPRAALWLLAHEHGVGRDRTLYGAAIIKTGYVRAAPVQLEVVSKEPPPRHANIVGWPSSVSDPGLARAAHRDKALALAEYAELVLR